MNITVGELRKQLKAFPADCYVEVWKGFEKDSIYIYNDQSDVGVFRKSIGRIIIEEEAKYENKT